MKRCVASRLPPAAFSQSHVSCPRSAAFCCLIAYIGLSLATMDGVGGGASILALKMAGQPAISHADAYDALRANIFGELPRKLEQS